MDSVSKKNRRRSGFKSYITDNYQERAIDVPEEPTINNVDPFLFKDEVVIAEARNVYKYAPLKGNNVVILGTLFVTNLKVSFVTTSLPVDTKENELICGCLHSDFLGLHDFCLTEIDSIYSISEGSKKKKLSPSSPIPNKIQDLLIVLKNFRNIHFNFNISPPKQDTKLVTALLLHRFPQRIDLFFMALDTPPPKTGIPEFRFVQDWERELRRTKCNNWRICKQNENFKAFPSLSSAFVVPHSITDSVLATAAHHFRSNRPLVWSWGNSRGAALVRMAHVSPNISNSSVENELIKMIHKSHSHKVPPTILDLDRELPSLKTLNISYNKLKDLHTPDSLSAFNENEKNYLSRWQSTGWLSHVKKCVEVTQHAAAAINIENSSVILQEGEGRDWSAVISCLVQILLDPYARTFKGFHTLVQKEWVALGHPFCSRLGHLKNSNDNLSPLWLVFLDCVHQISIQHPSALEFSQDYLIALWHASHCSLNSTFMFDSPKEEYHTYITLKNESRYKSFYFWPVWSWWARTEGLRVSLIKELQKKVISNSCKEDSLKDGLIPIMENNSISCRSTKENHSNEQTFEKERTIRKRMREKFINVLYVQSLLEPLLSPHGLSRLVDPVASAYNTWHRLFHLVGKADSPLPYDPAQPPPPLKQDNPLQIIPHWIAKPWVECFALWINEPSTHITQGQRPTIQPCLSSLSEHWKCIYDIVRMLQNHIATITQNGANP